MNLFDRPEARGFALWAAVSLAAAGSVSAADAQPTEDVSALRAELTALRQEYAQRLAALEGRLAEIEAQGAAPPPPQAQISPPVEAPAASGQPGTYFNPSLAMIGQFLAVAGHNPVEGLPAAEMRENELGLQAIVDPYARADFFLAFGEEGVEVEEGFITFTALPAGLLAKVGRMRPLFGKVSSQHLDVLPWPDQPLPVVNLLGEEGWVATGASLGKLIPLPADTFSELTVQVFRGDAEGLFQGEDRSDLAYNAHYRVFRDLGDASNLDLGLSYATGPNGSEDGADTRLGALDVAYRWRPLQQGTYRGFTLRGELFQSRRQQPGGTETALGWFVAGDYRLARRWFTGLRYESSERAEDASLRDTGEAWTLTFWPSEFSQVRGELRLRDYAEDITATELLLQLQFAIGAHGAHPF